jgi:hypothetical protein
VNKSTTTQRQQAFITSLNNALGTLSFRNKSTQETAQIRIRLGPVAAEVAKLVKTYAKNFYNVVQRYERIKKSPPIISGSESLFLIRMILSDHLPVVTTISNW